MFELVMVLSILKKNMMKEWIGCKILFMQDMRVPKDYCAFAVDIGGKSITVSNWDSQEALDASAESFQKIMADAQNYIKSPTIVTGEWHLEKHISFPAEKLAD